MTKLEIIYCDIQMACLRLGQTIIEEEKKDGETKTDLRRAENLLQQAQSILLSGSNLSIAENQRRRK